MFGGDYTPTIEESVAGLFGRGRFIRSAGFLRSARIGRCVSSGRSRPTRRCGEVCNNFGGGFFADVAVAVPNAALRQRVFATARAAFRVEFVKRGQLLLRRKLGEVDAWKLAGAVGMFQENL